MLFCGSCLGVALRINALSRPSLLASPHGELAPRTWPNIVSLSPGAVSALASPVRGRVYHDRRRSLASSLLDPPTLDLSMPLPTIYIYQHSYYRRASPTHPKPVPRNLPRHRTQSAGVSDYDLVPPTRRSRSQQTDRDPVSDQTRARIARRPRPLRRSPLSPGARSALPYSREGGPRPGAQSKKWPRPPPEPLRKTRPP